MRVLTKKPTFSVTKINEEECVLGLSRQFVTMNIEMPEKECFEIISPDMKNMNSFFISDDKSKCLFLNTTGNALLYDFFCKKTIKKVCFGDQLYNQCFAGYKDGYFYVDQQGDVSWFDMNEYSTKKIDSMKKCLTLYDDSESIYFIYIHNYDVEDTLFYQPELSCFSKKTGEFKDKTFLLPKGIVNIFKKIKHDLFLISICQKYGVGVCESIYIFDYNKCNLLYLSNSNKLDVCILDLDICIERKLLFVLADDSLLTIQFNTNKIIHSTPITGGTGVQVFGDDLIVTSYFDGAIKFDLDELT